MLKPAGGGSGFADLFTMWRHTRLVVMTSVIAAIHAAALIPFKPIPILPGVTEVRPGMAFPIVFSLLFGPAAAWGTAIGNTIGDLFGTLGPGTFFGFVGNLLYGYLPWRVWEAWRRGDAPSFRRLADWAAFVLAALAASGACALVVGWGIHLLGLFHFVTTAGIILLNNVLVCLVLGPPLLLAIHPRVARLNLLYRDLAGLPPQPPETTAAGRALARAATAGAAAAALAGIAAGYLAWAAGQPDAAVTAASSPFVLATLLASILA